MADLPNRLWREWDHAGNPRCTNALGQLQERQGSQNDTDLLYAAAQQPRQLVLVFRFDFDTQGWASHTPSMRQNILDWNCFLELFQAVRDLVGRSSAATDSEERVAATLERVVRDVTRVARGQQALFAIVDTLVRTFLTCVPDPPADAMPQSVARARDRYARFVKAAGQAMVGDALAAMRDLVNHVE
jgi:hypothetical protein